MASHIAMLNLIQQMLGAENIQNIQQGQNPDAANAPAEGTQQEAPPEGQDAQQQEAPAEGQDGQQQAPAANGG